MNEWLSDTDYNKAVGQLRLSFNGVFEPFNSKVNYGLSTFVPGAIKEAVKL